MNNEYSEYHEPSCGISSWIIVIAYYVLLTHFTWTHQGLTGINKFGHFFISPFQVAVCNLASIALPMYVKSDKTFDFQKLLEVTKVITRNLNKIIDINYYPVIEVRGTNYRSFLEFCKILHFRLEDFSGILKPITFWIGPYFKLDQIQICFALADLTNRSRILSGHNFRIGHMAKTQDLNRPI